LCDEVTGRSYALQAEATLHDAQKPTLVGVIRWRVGCAADV
jgi:hypothetical protein